MKRIQLILCSLFSMVLFTTVAQAAGLGSGSSQPRSIPPASKSNGSNYGTTGSSTTGVGTGSGSMGTHNSGIGNTGTSGSTTTDGVGASGTGGTTGSTGTGGSTDRSGGM